MDRRQLTNYVNFAALISYILGRVLNMGILIWIGLGIMTLSSIWTIIHWKQNDKMSNYISVAFLVLVGLYLFGLSPMTIQELLKNDWFRGFIGFIIWLILSLIIGSRPTLLILFTVVALLSIWILTGWKKNTMRRNYEAIGLLALVIIVTASLINWIGIDWFLTRE